MKTQLLAQDDQTGNLGDTVHEHTETVQEPVKELADDLREKLVKLWNTIETWRGERLAEKGHVEELEKDYRNETAEKELEKETAERGLRKEAMTELGKETTETEVVETDLARGPLVVRKERSPDATETTLVAEETRSTLPFLLQLISRKPPV